MSELIKQVAQYYDWKKILKIEIVPTSFEKLNVGDIVMSRTFTYSQKYMLDDSYEEYNMEKIGILLTKDHEYPNKSKLYKIKLVSLNGK